MKSKKIIKAVALALSASILANNSIDANANITVDDVMEEAYDELENKKEVTVGSTIIENDEPKVEKTVIKELDDLELGDIVNVNGFGNGASDGSNISTIEFQNSLMAIVKVKEDATYPYALAQIYSDGTISNIIGWFDSTAIKARYVQKTITEYADIEKTIIETENIPDYEPNTWDFLNEYYDYIDGKSIQVKYLWPEVEEEYDMSFTVRFEDNIQTREFYKDNGTFYYHYDWQKGTITHSEAGRDKIDNSLILKLK